MKKDSESVGGPSRGAAVHVPTEKLKHPSVVEAVCEFRFARGSSYTLIPGQMLERLRSRFAQHEVLPTAPLLAAIPEEAMLPPVPHHRFKSESPNALVQIGPRLLTVNVLPVYPSFEVFRDTILDVLEQYRRVADPGNPTRIGLRYINHVRSSVPSHNLGHYLKYRFEYPDVLPHPPRETSARLVFSYGELGSLGLAIAFPSHTAQGEFGALLDLDFSWSEPREFDLNRFPQWLEAAHDIIYQAFVSTVEDQVMSELRG